MRSAFVKDILRSIRESLGRFLAIMGIVALGCGFYAGLQMCGPDMRSDADALYDGTALWDLRLISTLGFSDDDVARVAAIEGVRHAMPSMTCDAMARLGTEQVAVRITSLDVDAAKSSRAEGLYAVTSSDEAYLNRPRLVEGRWPKAVGECVISADVPRADYGIGDTVQLLYGASELSDLLATDELKVVGTVSSSNYPYTGSFGSTTLGSGMIDQYLYVAPASLAEDAPYTEIYLTVQGAFEELSESDGYEQVVGATKDRIEALRGELSAARQDDLKAEAQKTLDEKWSEYEDERKKADQELADAQAELDDAAEKIASGEKELADGEAKYKDGLAQYEEQEAAARQQLADAAAQIEQGKSELTSKRKELEDGLATLDASKAELDRAEAELSSGEEQLAEGERTLAEGEAELEANQQALDQARSEAEQQIAAGEAAWEAQRSPLKQTSNDLATCGDALDAISALAQSDSPAPEEVAALVAKLEAAAASTQRLLDADLAVLGDEQAAAQIKGLAQSMAAVFGGLPTGEGTTAEELISHLQYLPLESIASASDGARQAAAKIDAGIAEGDEALAAQRDEALKQLDEGQAKIDAGREELERGRAELEGRRQDLEEARQKIADGRQQLEDGYQKARDGATQLADGQRKLSDAARELEEARAEAERQLADAKAQLDAAAAELEDGRAELARARDQYADGLVEYEDGKAEADEKIADALAQLNDAQKEVDELERPDIYALDRTQSEGAATYHADAGRIDAIADVFPFIFFLVAALVALTTMTRMVEDDRVLIGTYKALGYGTSAIAAKYLAYAGIAGAVGATFGIVVLSQVLPFIVMSAYSIIYTVPLHPFPLPISPGIAVASGGLGVGVTLLATWGAVVSSLREVPATLMLPRAPAAGKRIMLERVTPIWRRLSFTWKVTCRNLFRYKRRFLMTVIGISGCTALLLVGFGLHDAIWDIIDRQYGPIVHFDTTVGLDDNAIELDVRRVAEYLDGTGEVSGIVRVQNENMQAGARGSDETIRVNVVVPRSADEMAGAITFRNRISGADIALTADSVVITEKLALKYGLSVGDVILLFDQDDVGNAIGEGHELAITGIAENYVGNIVYVGRDAWKQVDDSSLVFSTIYASTTADEGVRKQIADELHDIEGVSTVIFSDETINMYRNMLSVVDMIVVVLIVSAAALAYIVLYNLTNINIGERIREIASLKVLGFTRGEVQAYIFREIAILAVMGDVLGMVLGVFLERFVVTTAEVDYVMFGRSIHPASFAYAFALTLVFTVLVIVSMRRKLDRVDMVESLKSVD